MTPILYVNAAGERGGAETVLLSVLKRLDRSRFTPRVVLLGTGGLVQEIETTVGVPVEVIEMGRFRNIARAVDVIRGIGRIIRRHEIRVVHSNGTGAHLYGGAAAWFAGVPSIYHVHDVVDRSRSSQGVVNLAAVSVPATVSIAVSNYVARELRRSGGRRHRIEVVHNGVDAAPEVPGDAAAVRCEFGWPADALVVVWCGRLQRWKGTDVFLRAAAIVARRHDNVRFLVIGGTVWGLDPGYATELTQFASELELDDRLRFTGYRTDVARLMGAADVVVHSSVRPEPFALVVLEAMTLGRPVIAAKDGGPSEVVVDGVTGLLTAPGDHDALAAAVLQLLEGESKRVEMGNAARKRADECFNTTRMIARLETIYAELASGRAEE